MLKCLPMLKHIAWNNVELEKLNPLLDRQMITGENLMLARVLLKKGCVVPEHSHLNEQITYIVEGALKFWIDGKEIVVHAGEVLLTMRIPLEITSTIRNPQDAYRARSTGAAVPAALQAITTSRILWWMKCSHICATRDSSSCGGSLP